MPEEWVVGVDALAAETEAVLEREFGDFPWLSLADESEDFVSALFRVKLTLSI